ncbi:MAG TPA: hypothetical protein PK478_12875, partial [Nitrospira sp.]|nr:hypothetical protein [Nitrospira sp.]
MTERPDRHDACEPNCQTSWYSNHVPGNKPPETFRWFAMLRYEFVVLLMMTSFLLVKGLRITIMCQGVNVEGLEAYNIRKGLDHVLANAPQLTK